MIIDVFTEESEILKMARHAYRLADNGNIEMAEHRYHMAIGYMKKCYGTDNTEILSDEEHKALIEASCRIDIEKQLCEGMKHYRQGEKKNARATIRGAKFLAHKYGFDISDRIANLDISSREKKHWWI